MKIIFLDIDGVLNSAIYDRQRQPGDKNNIDESRLVLLKELIDITDAKIVLSTSWRRHWEEDETRCDHIGAELNEIFGCYGLQIFSKTPEFAGFERAAEIQFWLDHHKANVKSFVIIDDIGFGWGSLSDHLIQTNYRIGMGLKQEHIERATIILNGR